MTTSDQINELATALSKAQAEMEGATKGSANPFFKSKYADLSSVWDACREPLTKHGLSVVQVPSMQAVGELLVVAVETRLLHTSGQWISGVLEAQPKDATPQAIGSTITYLRRYALQSFAGVAPEDDDGEAAQGRQKAATAQPVSGPAPVEGFAVWYAELVEIAEKGTERLEKAWKASRVEYRQYLMHHNPKGWEALKTRALFVDALKVVKA